MYELITTPDAERKLDDMRTNCGEDDYNNPITAIKNSVLKTPSKSSIYKKPIKLPFKKGGKKYSLYKSTKASHIPRTVVNFHETHLPNIAYDLKNIEVRESSSDMSNDEWNPKFSKMLINCGHGMYRKISIKTYCKLLTLSKVRIIMDCNVIYDGEDYPELVYEEDKIITSINELLYYLTSITYKMEAIFETQLKLSWYDTYNFEFKVMTISRNGEAKYYKNIDKFLAEYDINFRDM